MAKKNDDKEWCMYYGRMKKDSALMKENSGVHVYMLDEYILKTVEKCAEQFETKMNGILNAFKKELNAKLNVLKVEIDQIKSFVDYKKPREKLKDQLNNESTQGKGT